MRNVVFVFNIFDALLRVPVLFSLCWAIFEILIEISNNILKCQNQYKRNDNGLKKWQWRLFYFIFNLCNINQFNSGANCIWISNARRRFMRKLDLTNICVTIPNNVINVTILVLMYARGHSEIETGLSMTNICVNMLPSLFQHLFEM